MSKQEHDEIEKGMRYLSDFLGSQLEKLNVIAMNPKEKAKQLVEDITDYCDGTNSFESFELSIAREKANKIVQIICKEVIEQLEDSKQEVTNDNSIDGLNKGIEWWMNVSREANTNL